MESGHVKLNDMVDINGKKSTLLKTKISKIIKNDSEQKAALTNDNVLLVLEDVALQKDDCGKGDRLLQSNNSKLTKHFEAVVNILEQDEGGRKLPIKTNFKSQAIFRLFYF